MYIIYIFYTVLDFPHELITNLFCKLPTVQREIPCESVCPRLNMMAMTMQNLAKMAMAPMTGTTEASFQLQEALHHRNHGNPSGAPPKANPPSNKGLMFGLIKGNQWFINP